MKRNWNALENNEAYKTMKEIADILAVSKPTNAITESFKQKSDKERFITSRIDETNYDILIKNLKEQITLLIYEQQKNTKLLEENIENKRWWQWWK